MRANIKKSIGSDGRPVWELIVESENNVESERLRWWFEQKDHNQGAFNPVLVGKYGHFEGQPSAVVQVAKEVNDG